MIDPLPLVDVYGSDAVRFWAIRSASFGQDGTASIDALQERYERELGNDLGNLLSRTTAMIAQYRDGAVGQRDDNALAAHLNALHTRTCRLVSTLGGDRRARAIWDVVRELNRHVERRKPWELAKDDSRRDELDQVLYDLADGLRSVAVALYSFVPETASAILAALGQPSDTSWDEVAPGRLREATGIVPAAPLFPRIEPARAATS